MREIFSTKQINPQVRFGKWREVCEDRLVPMAQSRLGYEPFHAQIDGCEIGSLSFSRFLLCDVRAVTTAESIRHQNNKTDQSFVSMVLSGQVCSEQNGRTNTDNPGDICVRDTSIPWTIEHKGSSEVLAIAVSRAKLESVLGSSRRFAGLSAGNDMPVARLARSFMLNILSEAGHLSKEAADRMTSIGVDLIAASVAERMATELPQALSGTVLVQRAKAYATSNLSDPNLNPTHVAAAVGISLRHLQELFRENGQSVAAWIWNQRLEWAAQRLAHPAAVRLALGELAVRCGFADQAHFSRRFRERFGMSPRNYREAMINKFDKP